MLVYDLDSGLVVARTDLAVGVHDSDVVTFSDDTIVHVGGWAGTRSSSIGGVIRLDGSQPHVEAFALARARVYSTAHRLMDGRLAIVGGFSRDGDVMENLDSIEVFDGRSSVFATARMQQARRYHGSESIGRNLYVLGGTDNPGLGRGLALDTIEKVDVDVGSELIGRMQVPRYHFQSFLLEGEGHLILSVGGQRADDAWVEEIEIFDPSTGRSTIVGRSPPTVDHDRIGFCWQGSAFVMGGETRRQADGSRTLTEISVPGYRCKATP